MQHADRTRVTTRRMERLIYFETPRLEEKRIVGIIPPASDVIIRIRGRDEETRESLYKRTFVIIYY